MLHVHARVLERDVCIHTIKGLWLKMFPKEKEDTALSHRPGRRRSALPFGFACLPLLDLVLVLACAADAL